MKIYVAGPYTKPDQCENTHAAILVGNALFDAGYIPFVPHVTHLWHTVTPRPHSDWLKMDLAFLACCDAVLRLPGESTGADMEVARARELGIPIFYDLPSLFEMKATAEVKV